MLFQKFISSLVSLTIRIKRDIIANRIRITPVNSCVIDAAVSDKQLPDIEAIIHSDTNKVFI
jgi:hypothetical protein